MKHRTGLIWVGQLVLAAIIAVFVQRSLADQWDQFRALEFDVNLGIGRIAASAVVVLGVYVLLIGAWRGVLSGWKERLSFGAAIHVWCVSNLGRYLPGKVWSVAGLAVLAQRRGVGAWASVGSAVTMQALNLGSGILVVAFAVPNAAPALQLVVGGVVILVILAALVSPTVGSRVVALINRPDYEYHPLPLRVVAGGLMVTGAAWVGYGIAFDLLLEGVVPHTDVPLALSIGVFAAGYIAGFLALFAPGGIGVREVVYIALLTPSIGGGAAVAVSVASRLLLTSTEIVAALLGLVLSRAENERTAS